LCGDGLRLVRCDLARFDQEVAETDALTGLATALLLAQPFV
jgi:hypothetical protein